MRTASSRCSKAAMIFVKGFWGINVQPAVVLFIACDNTSLSYEIEGPPDKSF
jgi:hypothetical protein